VNAYLFSAGIALDQGKAFGSHDLNAWDECIDLIVCADNPEQAQQRFESWLKTAGKEGNQMNVEKIVAAQFLEVLLAESGNAEIDWPRICQEAEARLCETSVDDSEQGYWMDVNEFDQPARVAGSVEALKRELPDDISAGLNWSPEKTFLFVVSVLSHPIDKNRKSETTAMFKRAKGEMSGGVGERYPDDTLMSLPELAEKEAAILVEARNSLVAAWLWQKFATTTPLAANRIQISPWCQTIGIEK
jgi:hypothetical protein